MNTVIFESEMSDKIKRYWNERASKTDPASAEATTYDVFFRELEITKLREKITGASLPHGSTVIDLGCGDGYSTVSLAAAFPTVRFIGIDWSEEMLGLAEKRLSAQSGLLNRVSFRQGDMRRLSTSLEDDKFEVFLTMRSLINLTSSAEQYNTIAQIGDRKSVV
jgi:ubiquinone/menaquinone biosynthesis C-methylase UbiE